MKDESAGADAETKSIIDGADDASQLDAAESVREAEHSRTFELRNPTDEVEPILPKGESEDLLQQLDREQAAMKIQSMQRGRAARAKLTSRLSRKQSMRADAGRPPQNVRPTELPRPIGIRAESQPRCICLQVDAGDQLIVEMAPPSQGSPSPRRVR